MRIAASALMMVLGLALASSAHAQDAGVDAAEPDPELEAFRRMVDADPFEGQGDDPIARDARDDEMRTMHLPDPEETVEERIAPQSGEVLTAIPGVREIDHATSITLNEGLAIVREEMRFESRARLPAEVSYRLAIPSGAVLVALETCNAAGCRVGLPERREGVLGAYDDAARARSAGEHPLPIAHAAGKTDERGAAIEVRAAPVGRDPLIVRVTWALHTTVRGGRARFTLPARGNDVRAAEARVSVRAIDLVAPSIDGAPSERREELRAPSAVIAIAASLPITSGVRASAMIVPCGAGRCARLRAIAGRPEIAAGDVIVAIDASPSTVASARGRIAPTVRALLSMLPARSRVRVVAFASRSEEVSRGWAAPTSIDADAIASAVERDLGSATRFESLWAQIAPWARRGTRVVIVGDGGLTEGDAAMSAFAAARREGVRVGTVSVADRASTPGLRAGIEGAGGLVIEAGREAEDAAAGRSTEPLIARLTSLVAETVVRAVSVRIGSTRVELGALRGGDELAWEGPVSGVASIALDGAAHRASNAPIELGPALTALADRGVTQLAALDASDVARPDAGSCRARGPYESNSAVAPRETPLALASTRRCDPPSAPTSSATTTQRRSGLPSRVLLDTLRRRVIPPARACFRADRAGRPSYQERAELRIELADREIVLARVGGAIGDELRQCLLDALDRIEVPGFDGRVIVTWPLYTAPMMPPPVLELRPEIADEVDRVAPRAE